MALKASKVAVTGTHTAGIFADMTVDGPEIGTLVVVVDRAKNLPNRKTMGKQDPYCAARLGKEAKKTDTDRRGGQTPRWDQELRFTVHDSPDYYQLKVSLFNDDKKTDLIGETWISLKDIILPGGGQNDLWHNLNCRGRYAGEIRMELTYYDTRPREETGPADPAQASLPDDHLAAAPALSGPREPKPVKRRPLPAEPSSGGPSPLRPVMPQAQSSPLPNNPLISAPNSYSMSGQPAPWPYEQRPRSDMPFPTSAYDEQPASRFQTPYGPDSYLELSRPNAYNEPTGMMPGPDQDQSTYDMPYEMQDQGQAPATSGHWYRGIYLPDIPPTHTRIVRPIPQPIPKALLAGGQHSSPAAPFSPHPPALDRMQERSSPWASYEQPDFSSAPVDRFQDQPARTHSFDSTFSTLPSSRAYLDDDSPPPQPPAHRSSGSALSFQEDGLDHQQAFGPLPLNVRHSRGTGFSNAPSPYGYGTPQGSSAFNTPAPTMLPLSNSAPPTTTRNDRPGQFRDTTPSYYSPTHLSKSHDSASHLDLPTLDDAHGGPYMPQGMDRAGPRYDPYQDYRSHRASAPLMSMAGSSPDPRTPRRKSLSPQPGSGPQHELRSSPGGIPFSPDSYDTFNPGLSSARSINSLGARYNTPEQAREAAREREQEDRLASDGPIIGSDGRLIDPSDHLPTDTWAPEPEAKPIRRKGPEVTVRFRHSPSPQGAQPMRPAVPRPAREPQLRPHSIASMPQTFSPAATAASPTAAAAGRVRLQKRNRDHTSPAFASTTSDAPSPTYPLREHVNYGYNAGSSPTAYGRPMSSAAPPPIPAKVPLGRGQEDWPGNALSEELRNIDLGANPDPARLRRNRY